MSHFYGEMQGNRGEVSRTGSKTSGFSAHIRGWNIGVKIQCWHDEKTNKDEIHIYQTGGSSKPAVLKEIATLIQGKGETHDEN